MDTNPYNPANAFLPEGDRGVKAHPHLHMRTMPLPMDWTGVLTWGWTDTDAGRTYAIYAVREHGPDEDAQAQVFECRRRQDLEAALGLLGLAGDMVKEQRRRECSVRM